MLSPINTSNPLEWVQPDFKHAVFELRAQDEVVGTLRAGRPGNTLFVAQAAENTWIFTSSHLFLPQIRVTRIDEAEPMAIFQAGEDGGAFSMQDGRVFSWLRRGASGIWSDEQSGTRVHLYMTAGLTTDGGQTVIAPPAGTLPDLSLLILLGWCLLLLELDDLLMRLSSVNVSGGGVQSPLARRVVREGRELPSSS